MKSFNIEYKDKVYTFQLTRRVLKTLEAKGKLNFNEGGNILDKADALFYGALQLHHPEVTEEFAEKMLDDLTEVDDNGECEYSFTELVNALTKMVQHTFGEGAKAKKSIM